MEAAEQTITQIRWRDFEVLQPLGFSQHSIATSLGPINFYSADKQPWASPTHGASHLPTLLFLHGFGGGSSAYEWSKVYPAFSSEYRIVAPDLLGWGDSAHLARFYQIEDYLTTLTELISKTCTEPVTAIASCLTAAFVIRVAIDQPDLFKSLVLIAPAGLSDFGRDFSSNPFTQLVRTPILDQAIYTYLIANDWSIRSFLEQQLFARPERVSQEIVNAYLISAQQPNAAYSALSFVRGDLNFDLATYLPQLTTPTAILWGREAQFTPPELGQRLASLNSKAIRSFQLLDDVGLTPQLEQPAVIIGLIRQLLPLLEETNHQV